MKRNEKKQNKNRIGHKCGSPSENQYITNFYYFISVFWSPKTKSFWMNSSSCSHIIYIYFFLLLLFMSVVRAIFVFFVFLWPLFCLYILYELPQFIRTHNWILSMCCTGPQNHQHFRLLFDLYPFSATDTIII